MNMELRPLTEAERKYTFSQSQQLFGQTACVGHLRGDMDTDGTGFFTSWDNHCSYLKTDEFKAELDTVINMLRFDERYGGVLKNRSTLAAYCYGNPESAFETDHSHEFGFRVDTDKYSYLLRLNPNRGEYNFYCYCYEKEALDCHMKQAEKGIRFIDPQYKELFRIKDGEKIRINMPEGKFIDQTCRYIDDYHTEVGWNLYHICQFTESMEKNGYTVIPMRSSLPEQCYAVLPNSKEIIVVQKGESGYYKTNMFSNDRVEAQKIVDEYNDKLGVTKAQAEAMVAGSMFGWHVPAADPKNYDKDGKLIPVKHRDRGDAR